MFKCCSLFIALALVLFPGAAFAQNGDSGAFRELAERSLTYPGAPPEELRLYPDALPPAFPVALTYPEGTRLIGSIVRPFETSVFLSSERPAADVMGYYYELFQAKDWKTQEWPRWGFASAAEAYPSVYCQPGAGAWLNLSAMDVPGNETDVRITVYEHQGHNPCEQQAVDYAGEFPPMPFLTMPEGVRLTSVGQGGGQFGEHQASATMETERTLEEVASHFIPQLEEAGWQEAAAGGNAVTLWRRYRMQDGQGQSWTGQFFLTRLPGQNRTTAYVLASKDGAD